VPSDRRRAGEEGFTLIEVMAAMVILAIGLLALEALGIGAARSVTLAERQSNHATIASDSLESALDQLRRSVMPRQACNGDLKFGDRLSRTVTVAGPQLVRVNVRVIPNPNSINAPSTPFEVSSSLYLPNGAPGAVQGEACS
jgi:prepilin-type N-terminal cleavage/methylation domain-containing protein